MNALRFVPVCGLILLIFLAVIPACKSSEVMQNLSADERFELGMKAFEDEEYLEAVNQFEIVKLQFAGSAVADDAQFYLAECRFRREEYLLAATEYQTVRRNFPASPLIATAQYMVGLSYYRLSPKSMLDQEYTFRSIDEFQSFIDYFPADSLVPSAEEKIRELNDRLAQKDFETAELYMKLEYYKAATYYFSNVIEKFHDSPYAEQAYVRKIRALIYRKKFTDAKAETLKFYERFPDSRFSREVDAMSREIDSGLKASLESRVIPISGATTMGEFYATR